MKQNTKFLWIYIAILFSFALILILFAGLTQNNYKKELQQQATESEGVKQSLVTLTDKNQKMTDDVKKLKTEIESLRTNGDKLTIEKEALVASLGGDSAVTQTLLDAYRDFKSGAVDAAKTKIEGLDVKALTQAQLNIYNNIIGE